MYLEGNNSLKSEHSVIKEKHISEEGKLPAWWLIPIILAL